MKSKSKIVLSNKGFNAKATNRPTSMQ